MASLRLNRVAALLGALLFVLPGPAVPAARAQGDAAGFVGGIEDLPLMTGLAEVGEARSVFDTPDGRIVEAFAVGRVGTAEVAAFYGAALPQLGWTRIEGQLFAREGEVLRIEIGEGDGGVTVRFYVSPQ